VAAFPPRLADHAWRGEARFGRRLVGAMGWARVRVKVRARVRVKVRARVK
jgi:hypothetical protein